MSILKAAVVVRTVVFPTKFTFLKFPQKETNQNAWRCLPRCIEFILYKWIQVFQSVGCSAYFHVLLTFPFKTEALIPQLLEILTTEGTQLSTSMEIILGLR